MAGLILRLVRGQPLTEQEFERATPRIGSLTKGPASFGVPSSGGVPSFGVPSLTRSFGPASLKSKSSGERAQESFIVYSCQRESDVIKEENADVIADADKSACIPELTEEVHVDADIPEYNTDQRSGTHDLCVRMFEADDKHSVPDELLRTTTQMDWKLLHKLLQGRRERANAFADHLAQNAKKQFPKTEQMAEAVLDILDKMKVRRGIAKSSLGRELCLNEIRKAMALNSSLKLGVLTFPFRDMNPFKNVGQLPDAGEVEALIKLWTIGNAISKVGVQCQVHAMRDGTRYPAYDHYPISIKKTFGQALQNICDGLELGQYLVMQDVDEKGPHETQNEYDKRNEGHKQCYDEELATLMSLLKNSSSILLSAPDEFTFADCLFRSPRGPEMLPMFYAMLHGVPPSLTPVLGEPYGAIERRRIMSSMIGVFERKEDWSKTELENETEDAPRQALMWECLEMGAKYIAAYKSRSATNNRLQLDDVGGQLPGALRMSIHNKSPDHGFQFPIVVANSPHRTPWHGTAQLRYSRGEKRNIIDIHLAAELWNDNTAVIPSGAELARHNYMEPITSDAEVAWNKYMGALEKAGQPLMFADQASLGEKWQQPATFSNLLAPEVDAGVKTKKQKAALSFEEQKKKAEKKKLDKERFQSKTKP